MAGGGLTNNDLEKIMAMSVKDAHIASLFETLPDISNEMARKRQWRRSLSDEYSFLLEGKAVIK
jgi:hypothetical protein